MTVPGAATDVCGRVAITAVARALGLRVRRGRTLATWRDGTHYSVALSDARGAWCDHVTGDGGGVLELIRRVRGGDRQDALRWLASYAGVPLPERTWTATERREWARRRAAAAREAAAVEAWRADVLDGLRLQRDEHLRLYHAALRWIIRHGLDSAHGIAVADAADAHEAAYQRLDAHLAALRDATPAAWARAWREHGRVAA